MAAEEAEETQQVVEVQQEEMLLEETHKQVE